MNPVKYTKEQLEFFKQNYPYTDNGFFSLEGYIRECVGINWRNLSFSLIIQATRNMGKSYGTWEFIEKEIWIKSGFTERVAYCRTNLTKLKQVRSFFNSKYQGKYYMSETHIWKLEFGEDGREIKEARTELGAIVGVMNEENWRSGEFKNYRMIFWDEYNEANHNPNIFEHWINLFKTIERMTPNLICVLVGNKINANNDILVNLEIELPDYRSQKEDYLITRKDANGVERIFFVDIALETFKHLNQENKLANVWATFNEKTNAFLNEGAYLEQQSNNVLIYRTRILPTREILFYVSFGTDLYEYGEFEKGIYFHKVKEHLPDYRILSLDILGDMYYGDAKSFNNIKDYEQFAEMLLKSMKNNSLFFSLFETKENLERFIIKYTSLV